MGVKLGEICKFQSGGTPTKGKAEYFNGNIPWITTTALNGSNIDESDAVDWITEKAIMESAAKIVPAFSVMVGTRVGVGKVAINTVDMSTSQDIISLIGIDESVWSKEFLCKFLQGKSKYLNSQARGATIKGIKIDMLSSLELPDISLEEQQHISSVIDATKNIISSRQYELQKLDELVRARFIELFGDLKSNNKGWKIVNFKECADIDTNMIHEFEGYEEYPHIGIDSIEKETGRLVGYRTIAEDGVISGKYLFSSAHIIYSKIRPNLNKVAMPDFDGLCSADAYPILVKKGICNREYFGYTLRSQYFLDYILALSNRTNLPKVNKSQVEGFSLPLPPIAVQDQFAALVHQVAKSKAAVQKALDQTQQLFDSLMQEYFR